MSSHHVTVTREGRWWMIEIPAVDGLTQARRLSEVEEMARSYIVVDRDLPPSAVDVVIDQVIVDGRDVLVDRDDVHRLRDQANEAERRSADRMSEVAGSLAGQVPLRDIGELLGVSYQRAHQLSRS
jgi:tetrahydromethanopterin S-methyltransferase subunit G